MRQVSEQAVLRASELFSYNLRAMTDYTDLVVSTSTK